MNNYFENGNELDEWFRKRRSRFTASTNYKLIGTDGAFNTYVEEKVIELTTAQWERPELEETKSLLWGKVYEYPAYERYIQETKNYSMTYVGRENPIFYTDKQFIEESGGSPDVANILESGSIDYGAEIKCPRNPANHFKRLLWKNQWDVKEQYLSCYTQIQNLIKITGAFGWDFVSYDERQLSKPKQKIIIEIKPDQRFIDNLEIKIHTAIREKYKLLSKHLGVEIKNKSEFIKFIMS